MASRETNARLRMQQIIQTIVDQDRVVLGLVNFDAIANFFPNLAPNGPFCIVGLAKIGNVDAQVRHYDIKIPFRYYFGVPGDQNFDFTAAQDQFIAIFQALYNRDNYQPGLNDPNYVPPPDQDMEQNFEFDPSQKPLPAYFELIITYKGDIHS